MADGTNPDFYALLGIPRTATQQEIKIAFHKLAHQFHATGKPRNIEDVEEMRALATAYRVLSDSKRRERYDQFGDSNIGDEANVLRFEVARSDESLSSFDELYLNWIDGTFD